VDPDVRWLIDQSETAIRLSFRSIEFAHRSALSAREEIAVTRSTLAQLRQALSPSRVDQSA
jgi:hypothetical protein